MMKYLDKSTGMLKNYNNQPDVGIVFDTREWIHSSWIVSLGKEDLVRRMMKSGSKFEIAYEGYFIHAPRNRVFSLKWAKMNNDKWKIIDFCYKII